MAKKIEIKPNLLSGSISRIAESLSNRSYDNNRGLPHPYLSLVIGLVFGATGGIIATLILQSSMELGTAGLFGIGVGIPATIAGTLIGQVYFLVKELKNRKYLISPEGVIIVDDYLDKSQRKIAFNRVTDVEMEQPLSQRFFGTGNIKLNTAGSDHQEARIEFIKNTELVNKELSDMIAEANGTQTNNSRRTDSDNTTKRSFSGNVTLEPDLTAGLISNTILGLILTPIIVGVIFGLMYLRDIPADFRTPISLVFGAGTLLYMTVGQYFNLKATEYRFTGQKVEIYEGFLNVSSRTIPYDNVTDISMNRPIIQRVLGTGTINLNTAGSGQFEGSVAFIKRPEDQLEKIKKIAGV